MKRISNGPLMADSHNVVRHLTSGVLWRGHRAAKADQQGRRFTLQLRHGANFSDGTLSSAAVAYILTKIRLRIQGNR